MLAIEQNEARELVSAISGISFFFARNMATHSFDANRFASYQQQLFAGNTVNHSEQRAAWHTEFRNPQPCAIVQESLEHVRELSNRIRQNQWFFNVSDVVNIGIGGSDLGPKLICEAFNDCIDGQSVHFISNLDTTHIRSVLKKLSPANTLFIVTSKSFHTAETLENMHIAKQWLMDHYEDPAKHCIAITNNVSAAIELHQIPAAHVLKVPEWMGGRYSVWSAVGLPCAIALGFDRFYELHQGAHEMDQHFYHAPIADNKPIQYALMMQEALDQCDLKTLAILPYAHRLKTLPDYLQQLWMESLGKSVTIQNEFSEKSTGPIVFGSVGTNSQHSFQQLMMQGSHPIFADFILPLEQVNMVANCLMQVKTLRNGIDDGSPLKHIDGGKIANLFVLEKLSLKTLGALLAFYEHTVVTLAYLLQINPFDQWGVEHAKRASENLLKTLNGRIPSIEEIAQLLEPAIVTAPLLPLEKC